MASPVQPALATAASTNLEHLATLYSSMYQQMSHAMGGLDDKGQPLFKDVHSWLEATFPHNSPAHCKLVQDCQDLEQQCRAILNLPASGPYLAQVPAKQELWDELSDGAKTAKTLKLRIWQLDFRGAGQVKAGASLHAIRDCLHKNLVGSGNETGKYPAADSDLFDSDLFECIFFDHQCVSASSCICLCCP